MEFSFQVGNEGGSESEKVSKVKAIILQSFEFSCLVPELDFDLAGEKCAPAMVSEGGVISGSECRLSAPEAELEAVFPVLVGKLRNSGSP